MLYDKVAIGLHQGSALSPFLFIILVDTTSHEVCFMSSWELVYADDLAINDTTVMGAQEGLQLWNNDLTDSDLKINVAKSEYLTTRENAEQILRKERSPW